MFQGPSRFDFDLDYYVAGPMSGYEEYNYPAFEKAVTELREADIKILSPHEVPWPRGHETMLASDLWSKMMDETGKLVTQAGGIILLRGWPESKGARIELNLFLDQNKPVYYYDDFVLTDMNRRVA